jgi:hypothetical protein
MIKFDFNQNDWLKITGLSSQQTYTGGVLSIEARISMICRGNFDKKIGIVGVGRITEIDSLR